MPSEREARLAALGVEILNRLHTSVAAAIEAGQKLIEAKAMLDHGEWLPWLRKLGISPRTAQGHMALARNPNARRVAHLPVRVALEQLRLEIKTGASSGSHPPLEEPDSKRKRFWGSPALLLALVECIFGHYHDMCPYPRPPGFDALAMDRWPGPAYVNAPFSRHDELHRRGLSVWAKKAVEQWTQYEIPCALWLPVTDSINTLLRADAEVIPLGRIGYLDVDTGEEHPHPSASALFVLRDKKQRRSAEQDKRANQLLKDLRRW
jgi:hypothetical protein